jgi:hypothetical protein
MAKTANRPGIVTLIGVLGLISGVVKVVSGAAIALASNKDELFVDYDLTNTGVASVGVVMMLLGAFTLFLANSILTGAKWAQIWYGVVFTLNLVVGLVTVVTNSHGSRWAGLISAVIAFIVLQLLFSERAQAYFED